MLWVLIYTVQLSVCSYNVTSTFQSEFTIYSCLNVKKVLSWYRRNIWSLSDCNRTWSHKNLFRKQTLNHLATLAKLLSCVVNNYLYGAFDWMFLSCHVRISEWIHILYLPECRGTSCSDKARYLKFKWLQRDSNPQPLTL